MHTLTFHFSGDATAVGHAATTLARTLADTAGGRFAFGEPPMAWEGEVRVLTVLCDAETARVLADTAQQAHDAATCALDVRGVPPVEAPMAEPAAEPAPVKRRR
jgi:hypothetical protein